MQTFTKVLLMAFAIMLSTPFVISAGTNPVSKLAEKVAVTAKGAKEAVVDINSATEAQLRAIPGLGDTYAKKIIAGRPYLKKDQLKSKNIIPAALYEKIKDRIVAKQPKK